MKLLGSVAIFAGLAAAAAFHSLNQHSHGDQIVKQQNFGSLGVLTYYRRDPFKPLPWAVLAGSCGSNQVSCSNENRADAGVCANLLDLICYQNSQDTVNDQYVCLSQSGSDCCVSYTGRSPGFTEGFLCDAARKTMNMCENGGKVSGWATDVDLGGQCVHQCLSNRDWGC